MQAGPKEALPKSRNPFRRLLKTSTRHSEKQRGANDQSQTHIRSKKDNRKVLFDLQESEIAVYKNISERSMIGEAKNSVHSVVRTNNSKSSLISQGKFQIYQMNASLNYLTCGPLTHPIMPSSKFIKINHNTFIIPLKNPVRYWRLTLNTEDTTTIETFQALVSSIAVFKIDLIEDYTLQSPFTTFIASEKSTNDIDIYHAPTNAIAISNTSASPIILKSFLHNDSDESIQSAIEHDGDIATIPIHQPTPVRPNSASTTSVTSSILLKFNNEMSSVNTSHLHSPSDLANYSAQPSNGKHYQHPTSTLEVHSDILQDGGIEQLAGLNIDPDLDDDLLIEAEAEVEEPDLDLDSDLNASLQNFEKSVLLRESERGDTLSLLSTEDDDFFGEMYSLKDGNCWNNTGEGLTKRYSLSFKAYDSKRPITLTVLDKYKRRINSLVSEEP